MRVINALNKTIFGSLQVRIIFIVTLFMLMPVIYFLNYNFSRSEKILQEKTSSLILDNLQQVGNQIENTCLDIIKISNIISADNTIISTLSSIGDEGTSSPANPKTSLYDLSNQDKVKMIKIESRLDDLKTGIFFNYNADVILIDSNGIIYSAINREDEFNFKIEYMKKYKKQEWYKNLIIDNQNIAWLAPFSYDINIVNENSHYISAVRVIKGAYPYKPLGIIMVNINEIHFNAMLKNRVNGIVALINEDNNIIFCSEYGKTVEQFNFNYIFPKAPDNKKGFLSIDINKVKYLVNYYSVNRVGWNLVSIIPYKDVVKEIEGLKQKIFTLNIFTFFLLFAIAVSFILYITNPLKKLIDRIKKMRIGEHRIELYNENFSDDVSGIVKTFDCMFEKIEELVDVVIEEKRREHELKYEALRAQITPHFLFNTLNTIKWSAMMSGAGNVSGMISALGKLLEVSMNKGEDEVTFNEEFELIESYIFIQNARYNDKFILSIDADQDIGHLKVLKLIFQPLVENAIIHGLKNVEGKGIITIRAIRNDGYVKASVVDNGEGIPEEKIQQILDGSIGETRKQKLSGIGLANINERLKLRYGKSYGVGISSKIGCGTTVFIILPVIE